MTASRGGARIIYTLDFIGLMLAFAVCYGHFTPRGHGSELQVQFRPKKQLTRGVQILVQSSKSRDLGPRKPQKLPNRLMGQKGACDVRVDWVLETTVAVVSVATEFWFWCRVVVLEHHQISGVKGGGE